MENLFTSFHGFRVFSRKRENHLKHIQIMYFQVFQEFPNSIFGDLKLYFPFNKDSLVIKQCNVVKSIRVYTEIYLQDLREVDLKALTKYIYYIKRSARYNKEYIQIGNPFNMITSLSMIVNDNHCNLSNIGLLTGNLTLIPQSIQIDKMYSTIIGCKMN